MGETGVTPVAVIDAACRLPGGVDSPDTPWEAVRWSDDMITEIPSERWDAEEHYDPERGVPGRSVSRSGGFLDDVMGFDAPFFGFGEREAAAMDPHHRLLLENSWEAVEHAGLAPPSLAGFLTGVFAGLCREAYKISVGGGCPRGRDGRRGRENRAVADRRRGRADLFSGIRHRLRAAVSPQW